jgi:hypothetical protein
MLSTSTTSAEITDEIADYPHEVEMQYYKDMFDSQPTNSENELEIYLKQPLVQRSPNQEVDWILHYWKV